MGTYFNPFVGRPIEPDQLAGIAAVYREALEKEGVKPGETDAAILAARAIRLYQIGIRERGALLRALLWFYRMTTRSRHRQETTARQEYTIRIRF